jgi:predicted GNAT family acetyltransferase
MIERRSESQYPKIQILASGSQLLSVCGDWLFQEEAANNTLISVAALSDSDKSPFKPPYWFAAVFNGDQVVGCALHVLPDGLLVSDMPPDAAHQLAKSFVETGIDVPRISGREYSARTVAKTISLSTDSEFHPETFWQSYVLTNSIKPPKMASGHLRLATAKDSDIVTEYGKQYGEEKPAFIDVAAYFLRKASDECLWAWDDDGIRTLIAVSGRTENGIRIAGVFTPVKFRGNGYASAATWAVTEHYLNDGCSFTTLVVDKTDPHVMRLYEHLGYEKLESAIELIRSSS